MSNEREQPETVLASKSVLLPLHRKPAVRMKIMPPAPLPVQVPEPYLHLVEQELISAAEEAVRHLNEGDIGLGHDGRAQLRRRAAEYAIKFAWERVIKPRLEDAINS